MRSSLVWTPSCWESVYSKKTWHHVSNVNALVKIQLYRLEFVPNSAIAAVVVLVMC